MGSSPNSVSTRIPLPRKLVERCSCAFLEVGQTWKAGRMGGQYFPVRKIVRIDEEGITYAAGYGRTKSVGFVSIAQWIDFYDARLSSDDLEGDGEVVDG